MTSPVVSQMLDRFAPGTMLGRYELLATIGEGGMARVILARQIEGEHAPPAVVGVARAGDMFATMTEVPEGVASACAVGLPPDLSDSDLDAKVKRNLDKIEVRCTPIPAGATVVVVEVPPWPRLD